MVKSKMLCVRRMRSLLSHAERDTCEGNFFKESSVCHMATLSCQRDYAENDMCIYKSTSLSTGTYVKQKCLQSLMFALWKISRVKGIMHLLLSGLRDGNLCESTKVSGPNHLGTLAKLMLKMQGYQLKVY